MARTLDVYLHNALVGNLIQDAGGQMVFEYVESWPNSPGAAPLGGPWSIDRPARRRQQIAADRLAVITGQPADGANAQSFTLEFLDIIQVSPPQQWRPSSVSRIGLVAHRRRVVDFSFSIKWIFASAVTIWFACAL